MKKYKRYLEAGDEEIARRTAQRYRLDVNASEDEAEHEIQVNTNSPEHENLMNTSIGSNNSGQVITTCEELVLENRPTDDFINLYEKPQSIEDNFRSFYNPESLEEFMKSESFFEQITTPVDKSRGELFLMILKYSISNHQSVTAMTNLFKLFNTVFKTPILPESSHITDKLLNPKDGVEFHALCHNCSAYLGEFGKIEPIEICRFCQIEIDLSNSSNTSFFVLINPSKQISDLLNIYENHYDYVIKSRAHEKGSIEDVYDGKLYRKFVNSLSSEDRFNYVSAMFNTDGAEKFKCSKYSIWPLFLKINELPKQDRNNKLITCGLWFHKKKPEMSVLLDKLVDLLNPLSNEGIMCNIKGEERRIKLHVLSCCVDSVARAPIQGIKQFNGKFGCNWCLHPGQYSDRSMKYPVTNTLPKMREHDKTVEVMLKTNTESDKDTDTESETDKNTDTDEDRHKVAKKYNFGIKYPSPLMNLSSFDIVQGFAPDYLHCCLEGVASQLTNYYLQWLSDDQINELDMQMNSIAAPDQIQRLCRPISCRNHWKAREYENFVLYYSVPVLSSILTKSKLDHWQLFVESLYILLKDKMNINELNHADFMLHKFVAQTQELFGIRAMTFNIHQMLHICESVVNWGPLWTNSTFCFESANHHILRAIKCSKGVTNQIVRYVNINHSLLIIEEYVNSKASEAVIMYCNDTLSRNVKNFCKTFQTVYFGKGDAVENIFLNNLRLSEHSSKYFLKMVKGHCLYESHHRSKKRSNNSFALLDDGKYVRIVGFIVDVDNKKEFTVTDIDPESTIIHTKEIVRICIFMNIFNTMYICPVPNSIHY